jgi:hypothetical protein
VEVLDRGQCARQYAGERRFRPTDRAQGPAVLGPEVRSASTPPSMTTENSDARTKCSATSSPSSSTTNEATRPQRHAGRHRSAPATDRQRHVAHADLQVSARLPAHIQIGVKVTIQNIRRAAITASAFRTTPPPGSASTPVNHVASRPPRAHTSYSFTTAA